MILKNKINKSSKRQGRNNEGKITVRHRGGGVKRNIRILKESRSFYEVLGTIKGFEYDPNRNVDLAVVFYQNGAKDYIIKPRGLSIGDKIKFSSDFINLPAYSTFLSNINTGIKIYNVEFKPFSRSSAAKAADSFAVVLGSLESRYTILLLPSKEVRMFPSDCIAYIGIPEKRKINKHLNKAGRSRRLGIRPTVRGSAMNAVDHPHGGGEGKAPIGRKFPLTPWGKNTLGLKTRSKKLNNLLILKRYR